MAERAALVKGGMLLAQAGVLHQVLCSAPHTASPILVPTSALEPHSQQRAVPTDAGTCGALCPRAEVLVWLLAVPM